MLIIWYSQVFTSIQITHSNFLLLKQFNLVVILVHIQHLSRLWVVASLVSLTIDLPALDTFTLGKYALFNVEKLVIRSIYFIWNYHKVFLLLIFHILKVSMLSVFYERRILRLISVLFFFFLFIVESNSFTTSIASSL